MTLLQGLVQAINQQPQAQQAPLQQPQSRLRTFLSTQPPTFSQAVEPMEADDWLRTIDSKLRIAQCNGREKVLFASHQLSGPAQEWWTAYTAAHEDPQEITWAEFRNSFRAHHVPTGEIKLKRKEFLSLKQGPMSVREYLTKFTQLSRYAPSDVDTDEKKQDCFLEGLNTGLQYAFFANEYPNFQKLVDRAFILEKKRQNLGEERKRHLQGQSSGSNTRPRFNAPALVRCSAREVRTSRSKTSRGRRRRCKVRL
ncbi:uncharacterized protein LOC133901479 [Phragmites australis]|uniref:uncharacterized protein LOC133901479 n=1 Tax=Phragmites australis TaxID=29695 RepID=UPI002D783141|nr:uncharacterized protein LOC133901479 [Phragmites australis]